LTFEKGSMKVLSGPDIVSRGFIYVRESEPLMREIRNIVKNSLDKCLDKNISDWGKIKNIIKDDLNEYLWKELRRSPLILPIIVEA